MTTPLRRSARLQQSEDCNARSEIVGASRKKRRFLPSPSTSGSFGKQVRDVLTIWVPLLMHTQAGQRLEYLDQRPDAKEVQTASEDSELRDSSKRISSVAQLPGPRHRQKRKTTETEAVENLVKQHPCEPPAKRTKSSSLVGAPGPSVSCDGGDRDHCHPIEHWASTGLWPKNFSDMSQEQSDSSRKRGRGSSYTQSVKDGSVPKAHTSEFEKEIAQHGILMDDYKGQVFVSEASKELGMKMLQARYGEPRYPPFQPSKFLLVLNRVRTRNETRIFRDITPFIVPSAELLFLEGQDDLEDIAEELNADWKKCDPMGGPAPRPDFAAGIASSAFTDEQIAKLKNHSAWQRPTLFTSNMYFPFLLCEAKSGNQAIARADRQNAQSSSLAVNAVIELHRVLGDSHVSQLSGQVLVFSVSHDHEQVKIYGHYAILDGTQTTFYRYLFDSFNLNIGSGQHREKVYGFVRELYHKFYRAHLKRICDALSHMEDPRTLSMTSSMSVQESDSQELDPGAPSSQETLGFKIPNAPASKKQKGEMVLLREQLAKQEKQNKEQTAQLERLYKEQVALQEKQYKEQEKQYKEQEKQYKEQEKQYKEQMAQQGRQLAQQSEMLKQLLERR